MESKVHLPHRKSQVAKQVLSPFVVALFFAMPILLTVLGAKTVLAAAPTCDGKTATIYVSGGLIVGGPDDGDTYSGELDGTSGNDVLVGTSGVDEIDGGNGDDTICGLGGNDEIDGGIGDDTVFGGDDDDTIDGSTGNDFLCGDAGADTIDGENGDDTLCGGTGNDTMFGGIGNDKIDAGDGTDSIEGQIGTDICVNGETVNTCEDTTTAVTECTSKSGSSSSASSAASSTGSSVGSSTPASSSSAVSSSVASSSVPSSSAASSSSSSGVPTCNGLTATIYVSGGLIVGGPDDGDPFTGDLNGTSGDDVIVGTFGGDTIKGKDGNDTICGLDGADDIEGDDGDDYIEAGPGNDDVNGEGDNDEIYGGEGADALEGGPDDDFLCGDGGMDDIEGNSGNDTLCGGDGPDFLDGGSGEDKLDGGADVDDLDGGLGSDLCLNGESLSSCETFSGTIAACTAKSSSSSSSVASSASSTPSSGASSSIGSSVSSIPASSSSAASSAVSSSAASSITSSSPSGGGLTVDSTSPRGGDQGTGSHRGSGTDGLRFALGSVFAGLTGRNPFTGTSYEVTTVPPGGYGGGAVNIADLTDLERRLLCKAQGMLRQHVDRLEARMWAATLLSKFASGDTVTFYKALGDPNLCEGITEVRRSYYGIFARFFRNPKQVVAKKNIQMAVGIDGVPISSSVVWNDCIRNKVPVDKDGNPYNCMRWHEGNNWIHPDIPNFEVTWNPRDPRGLQVASNVTVVVLRDFNERTLVATAARLNGLQ